ncbi:MAG: bifunctional transaldolase/phosoglucose isomerase, partial [Janthinobacterium lividum]
DDTIAEARRLWAAVDRPNLMVKVPGTKAGTPAIETLIGDGININVTLLFSIGAYQAVATAYMTGLEARLSKGEDISRIASVASFFVSRIDALMDKKIKALADAGDPNAPEAHQLSSHIAIANAKLAYSWYQEMIGSTRWSKLAAAGAMPQRLLWASTGTKSPELSDVLYVDSLIGPDTVNTIPPKTMDAFRDHGTVAPTLTADLDGAKTVLERTAALGLDLPGVTAALVVDGVKQFADAADSLLGAVAGKRAAFLGDRLNRMNATLPHDLQAAVDQRIETARAAAWSRRLWHGDATLWTGHDEAKWLGWLAAGKGEQVDVDALEALGRDARGYADAVLLGMGGSSLGPEVLAHMFEPRAGCPRLHVLDTTDPGQIGTVAAAIDPARTLFIVASKSGSTLEPEILRAYFFDLVERAVGSGNAGRQFIAVTDPGSKLEKTAKADGYAHVFSGDPEIGGRYSVLSAFGMVPAAIIGLDVRAFYDATKAMVFACGPDAPPQANPGLQLGAIMGEALKAGRDKLTFLPSAGLAALGPWLEQLIAESTGKLGTGIVPVDGEPIGDPSPYGTDRLFVHLHLEGDSDDALEARLSALTDAGQPLVRITVAKRELVGQEFFRWEVATAFAGAIIGVDPFDQPDVEDAKIATRQLVDAFEATGTLAKSTPLFEDADFAVFTSGDATFAATDLKTVLALHFAKLQPGDYAGFLAYIERNDANTSHLTRLRTSVRNAKAVATVVGFGPRFLHSTGQAYKGGPASGVFLVVTGDHAADLTPPGHRASFGTVELAQAIGDTAVLDQRGQRTLRVHLKGDAAAGLDRLVALAIEQL